jgi:tetratricopeptide (TPR) repeat protein
MIFRKIFFPVFLCFGFIAVIHAGNFNTFYRTGLRKLRARDYDVALSKFKEAYDSAELSHEEVKILLIIADVCYRQKKYKEAKTWVARILDIPDLKLKAKITTYRRLISYSVKLKRYDDALDEVRRAMRSVSDNKDKAVFLIERSKIFEVQKKYPRAVESLLDCIEICKSGSPQWQSAQLRFVIVLYRQKKYKEILKLIPELQLDEWSTSSQQLVYYYAGLCAYRERDYKLAASWFERIPDNGRSWLVYSKNSQLGNCWKKMRKYEKAYICFEVIYKNNKLQSYYRANGLWLMADLRYLQKNYKASKLLCEKLKKFPKASKSQIKRADRLLGKMKKIKP